MPFLLEILLKLILVFAVIILKSFKFWKIFIFYILMTLRNIFEKKVIYFYFLALSL